MKEGTGQRGRCAPAGTPQGIVQDPPIRPPPVSWLAQGHPGAGDAGLEEMDGVARARADESSEFAENSPLPDPSMLYKHVWAEINPNGRLFFDGRDR